LCAILFFHFLPVPYHDENPMIATYGYPNVCLFWDFRPSSYFAPFFWAMSVALVEIYLCAIWAQMYQRHKTGLVGTVAMHAMSTMKLFEGFGLLFFHISIANPPLIDMTDPYFNTAMVMHTIPFCVLMVVLLSFTTSNCLQGSLGGYWDEVQASQKERMLWLCHLGLLAVSTMGKLAMQANGLIGGLEGNGPFFCNNCQDCTTTKGSIITLAYTARRAFLTSGDGAGAICKMTGSVSFMSAWDKIWLFLALVIPLCGAIVKARYGDDRVHLIAITFRSGTRTQLDAHGLYRQFEVNPAISE